MMLKPVTIGTLVLCFLAASAAEGCAFFKLEQSEEDNGGAEWDTGGGSGPATPGGQCGFSSSNYSCDDCLNAWCCGQAQDCAAEPQCVGISECTAACGPDMNCNDGCWSAFPNGADEFGAFSVCLEERCWDECIDSTPDSPPAGEECGFYDTNADCTSCVNRTCCAESLGCINSASCIDLNQCLFNCGTDENCIDMCLSSYPEGLDLVANLYDCMALSCGSECGF